MLTGVGRPIRPRPKLDKEKRTPIIHIKNSTKATTTTTTTTTSTTTTTTTTTSTTASPLENNEAEDSILLERLFGVQSNEQEQPEPEKDPNVVENPGAVEQIVEVVTSISTKVSSSIKNDQMHVEVSISNSTTNKKPSNTTEGETSNSDRKIATSQDVKDQILVDNLRKFAEVRTGNDAPVKKPKNETRVPPNLVRFKPDNIIDLEKLKKIADVAARENNGTVLLPKETTINFTLSRDGIPVLTKVLTKAEDRNDKMISTTEENTTSQARKWLNNKLRNQLSK